MRLDLSIDTAAPPRPEELGRHTHSITNLPDLERAYGQGDLRDWDALMRADPTATFFQGPAWCMAWYRSHTDLFQPLTVVVTSNGRLVGLVPLAVERSTRRLAFAGDGMTDYRDVVALPGHREAVIVELLRICRTGHFPNDLRVGPIPPGSETLRILLGGPVGAPHVRLIVRYHSTWRWRFHDADAVKRLTSKESVRRHLSYYKRKGLVALDRIDSAEAWDRIKQDFFDHHSLRQLYTERPLVFNRARNRAFYDALFRGSPSDVHLSILRAGDRPLAIHFGYVAKGVLYWGAPAFDIREERHSPGQILLALLIQRAAASDLQAVDLTLGVEEFKKRFSNEQTEVATVEVYARAHRYYARKVRDGAVAFAKAFLLKLLSRHAWNKVRTSCLSVTNRTAPRKDEASLLYVAEVTHANLPGAGYLVRQNMLPDLLKYDYEDPPTAAAVAEAVKEAPTRILNGHTLHTLLVNEELLAWGWSLVGA